MIPNKIRRKNINLDESFVRMLRENKTFYERQMGVPLSDLKFSALVARTNTIRFKFPQERKRAKR